jgi:hypothetical protein
MARRCELSRSHFNLLIRAGIMPAPLYDLRNRRPFYDAELQQICVRVRETSIGADGKYVVFYDRRSVNQAAASPTRLNRAARSLAHATAGVAVHAELIEGLVALGIQPTVAQVETALRACYPAGHDGIDEGTVLRELWRHLRRPNVDR